jgi:hypothetical protein
MLGQCGKKLCDNEQFLRSRSRQLGESLPSLALAEKKVVFGALSARNGPQNGSLFGRGKTVGWRSFELSQSGEV